MHLGVRSDIGDFLSAIGGFLAERLYLTVSLELARWSKPSVGWLVGGSR